MFLQYSDAERQEHIQDVLDNSLQLADIPLVVAGKLALLSFVVRLYISKLINDRNIPLYLELGYKSMKFADSHTCKCGHCSTVQLHDNIEKHEILEFSLKRRRKRTYFE